MFLCLHLVVCFLLNIQLVLVLGLYWFVVHEWFRYGFILLALAGEKTEELDELGYSSRSGALEVL